MKAILLALMRDESGLTMVEYAVGGGLIISVCVVGITTLGGNLLTLFNGIVAAF